MEKIKIYGWNGYKFSAQGVVMVVTPEIGGRIISLSYEGTEIFFVQKEFAGQVLDFSKVSAFRAEKRKLGFRVWGGDKTWVAPQKDWWEGMPPLELDAGSYPESVYDNTITMVSPVCRETGLQIARKVTLNSDGSVHLGQEITNKGNETVYKGIWNVTQLVRPFDVYVPTTKDKLRSYHHEDLSLPDHHIMVDEVNGWCCIPCRDNQLFKFGGMVNIGAIVSLKREDNGTLAFLKTFDIDNDAEYFHQSAVEVFNALDHDYLEVETHASTVCLRPGQACSHGQTWRLKRFPKDVTPDQVFENMTGTTYQGT